MLITSIRCTRKIWSQYPLPLADKNEEKHACAATLNKVINNLKMKEKCRYN